MAELPANQSAPQMPAMSLPGGNFLRGALGMPWLRQMVLLFAIGATVAMAVMAVLWMRTPDFRPVTGLVSGYQVSEIVRILDERAIDYRMDERSGAVLVPSAKFHEARMMLAGSGVVEGNQLGYEILDKEQGFGVSQFTEVARHRRGLEGELARSIATINAVHNARVLLAMPKSTTFLRDQRKPRASVTLSVLPGKSLSEDQIRGITNLVAGAVPELSPDDVAVVDQSGKLLSVRDEDPRYEESERQLAYVKKIENQLREKIGNILEPTLGLAGFSAEVSVDVDFTRTEQAEELFNPDLTALRSEETLEEENVGDGQIAGVPGVLTNQPAAAEAGDAAAEAGAAARKTRLKATRNYEVDRTLSYTQHQVGEVQRISASVLVNDLQTLDPDSGETVNQTWTEEDLERLAQLVKNAVGYRADRGDTVTVINRPFLREELTPVEAAPFWTESWFITLVKQSLGALLLLFLMLGILRPLYRNLSQAGAVVKEQERLTLARMAQEQEARRNAASGGALALGGAGAAGSLPALPGSAGYQQKVDAVRGLVDEDPERVAQVVKHWVSADE